MTTLPMVVALAIAWHISLALLERLRHPKQARPPLAKLLLSAEVDLLRTLRGELKRRLHLRREPTSERKLSEVERRLEELGGDGR
ncbi:hypothetical protein ES706_00988 [subsurface metagenome]|nr:hypothetical protein [Hadesarchaea archaeon]